MAQKLNIDIVAKDRSKQALNGVQKSLGRLKSSVFNLRNAFIGLGAGLVLRGIINAGMQIEELGVQLEALFGSAKKGKTVYCIEQLSCVCPHVHYRVVWQCMGSEK